MPMGLLSLKNTNYNGGRPRVFGSLMFCPEDKRHGFFMGYAPCDLKKGDTVCISMECYETLLKKVDHRYEVNVTVTKKCRFLDWLGERMGIRRDNNS